ncbi:hypothetical protein C7271_03260 [filamentous cyanobacterium CCP5]|nr:hypothetical protein C7271_03260 [filamentous cyanobacterium CCP5]
MNNVVQAFYSWYRNTLRHPKYRWLLIAGSLLYLISPLDISPDLIPIIGWIDDGLIATLLVAELSQMLFSNLNRKSEATESIKDEGPVIDVEAQ